MKKFFKPVVIVLSLLLILLPSQVFASSFLEGIDLEDLDLTGISSSKLTDLENTIENFQNQRKENNDGNESTEEGTSSVSSIDTLLDFYEELSRIISNEEIVTFIDNNKTVLSEAGISKSILNTTSYLLKNFDSDTVIDVIKSDLNLEQAIKNSKEDASADAILKSAIKNTSTSDKIRIVLKLLFSNGYIRILTAFAIVISIYSIFITSYIFKKAGKSPYATLIPLYRDIVHLKMCNFTPWLLILLVIPLIGWLALVSIYIVGKFELSRNFGHGFLFGLGLLFLPPVFRTYLAFSDDEFKEEK